MKAIGYIRVSTKSQAEEGVSLEAQKAKIEAWCLANDYELLQIFEDAGISGKATKNRSGFQKAIAAAGQGMALVAYSMSRISRSTKDMLMIAEKLEKSGADLVSLSEKIDTTTAAGKMVFRMLSVLNEFERDQISERTKAALSYKKAKGQRIGNIQYGYELAGDKITLKKNETEAAILADIRELRKSGFTLQAIADQLNKDGFRTRAGSQWKHQYVSNLLKIAA